MAFVPSPAIRRTIPVALVLSAWWFHSYAIAPLEARAKESSARIEELRDEISTSSKVLHDVKEAAQLAGEVRAELNRQTGDRREEAAMMTFPDAIKEHFSGFGLPPSVVRLNTVQREAHLTGYERAYWSIGLPVSSTDKNLTGLLLAVAAFDRRDTLTKVVDFVLQPNPENPGERIASVNIVALIRK
jgi:hypothetical protein